MKNVLVRGCDSSDAPRDYRKIYGFESAFSKLFTTKRVHGDNNTVVSEIDSNYYDIVFGEGSLESLLHLNFNNVKNCVLWSNFNIDLVQEIAKKHRKTNFILAPKSIMHVPKINEIYRKIYGDRYYSSSIEGQDLSSLEKLLTSSTAISMDSHSYRIDHNFAYCFLPCSLSEIGNAEEYEYDVCYFGTTHNRPKVESILKTLEKKGYRTISTYKLGFIRPEQCIDFYKKTVCCLTQQVEPVILEFPVRLGESSANGCKVFVIDSIMTDDFFDILVPKHEKIIDFDISKLELYVNSNKDTRKRKEVIENFQSTYDNAVAKNHKNDSILRKSLIKVFQ